MASHKYQLSNIRNIAKVVNTSSMLLELLENLRRTFLMFGWTVSKYTMILQIQHQRPYVIFVFLLTPAPFSADTKNTLIPDFLTPKYTKFKIFTPKHTNSHFFDIIFTLACDNDDLKIVMMPILTSRLLSQVRGFTCKFFYHRHLFTDFHFQHCTG